MSAGPISALDAVRQGARRALEHYPAAVWTYVLLTLTSMPVALMGATWVHGRLGHSERAATFASGLDAIAWLGLLRAEPSTTAVVTAGALGLACGWIVASTYLAGATINAVSRPDRTKTSELFAGGGRVIGRLLRLLGIAGPFLIVVVAGTGAGVYYGVTALTREMISEKAVLAIRCAGMALAAAAFAWAATAHDFMRVEAVARGEHRARFAFWRGLKRAARHPFAALALAGAYGGAAITLTLLLALADVRWERTTWFAITVGFLLQQWVTLARAWLRVGLAGAEVAFVMSDPSRR